MSLARPLRSFRTSWLAAPRRWARDFRADKAGAIAVMFALVLPILVGFIALGVEVGYWFVTRRATQNAADMAAIAAAYEILNGGGQTEAEAAATTAAQANGYPAGLTPSVTTPYSGDSDKVEVILTRSTPLMFARLFMGSNISIQARAVGAVAPWGEACVLALHNTAARAVSTSGSASVTMTGCSVAANSNADDAIYVGGTSDMNVECASTVGGIDDSHNNLTTNCAATREGAEAVQDPYSDLTVPAFTCCDYTGTGGNPYSPSNGDTLSPGVYKGLKVNSGDTVTLNPGTYIVDQKNFSIAGGATVTGTGVTIIFTNSTGGNYPSATISGGANVTLSAPTSGTYGGILFYHPGPYSASTDLDFTGGSTMELTGVIYAPNNNVDFSGGNSTGGNCTKIAARTIEFGGNADINTSCDGTGVPGMYLTGSVGLVE
jgi:hypothetical protein